ncbi:MAG: hypothetical protein ACLSVD_03955 [Eggerthellaceae bacterium]
MSTVYARNAETGKYVKATASSALSSRRASTVQPEFLKFFCPATVENEIQVVARHGRRRQARQPGRRPQAGSGRRRAAAPCPDDPLMGGPTAARAWTCPRSAPRRFYT